MSWKKPPTIETIDLEDLVFTDPAVPSRSCCCPALPVVKVVMPPSAARRHPVDLWLCGHHCRASVAALLAAGATVQRITMPADTPRTRRAAAPAQAPLRLAPARQRVPAPAPTGWKKASR